MLVRQGIFETMKLKKTPAPGLLITEVLPDFIRRLLAVLLAMRWRLPRTGAQVLCLTATSWPLGLGVGRPLALPQQAKVAELRRAGSIPGEALLLLLHQHPGRFCALQILGNFPQIAAAAVGLSAPWCVACAAVLVGDAAPGWV